MEDGKQYMNSHDAKLYKWKDSEETSIQAIRGGWMVSYGNEILPGDIAQGPKNIWSTERTIDVVKEAAEKMTAAEVFKTILQTKGNVTLGEKEYNFSSLARKTVDLIAKYHALNDRLPANKDILNIFIAQQASKKRAVRWERAKGVILKFKPLTLFLKTH